MTYGAVVPRLQPRPTLDNLQEPLVPFGTRPIPSNRTHQIDELSYTNSRNLRDRRSPSIQTTKQQSQPRKQSTDDNFGTSIDEPFYPLRERERSPSVFLDIPDTTTFNQYPISSSSSTSKSGGGGGFGSGGGSKSSSKTDKAKQKLHLPLGRLGRSAPIVETPETARIREDHHIHVANPTFTRENLRQRNYDAFFESGQPVYSIEKRAPSQTRETTPNFESNHINNNNNNNHFQSSSSPSTTRHHTVGFFHRKDKSPSFPAAEIVGNPTVEVYQKGDRCPHLNIFFVGFLFFV